MVERFQRIDSCGRQAGIRVAASATAGNPMRADMNENRVSSHKTKSVAGHT